MAPFNHDLQHLNQLLIGIAIKIEVKLFSDTFKHFVLQLLKGIANKIKTIDRDQDRRSRLTWRDVKEN